LIDIEKIFFQFFLHLIVHKTNNVTIQKI